MMFQTFGMYLQVCGYARVYASQGDPDAFANSTGMARTASLSGNFLIFQEETIYQWKLLTIII